jgi:hypothetical protein
MDTGVRIARLGQTRVDNCHRQMKDHSNAKYKPVLRRCGTYHHPQSHTGAGKHSILYLLGRLTLQTRATA